MIFSNFFRNYFLPFNIKDLPGISQHLNKKFKQCNKTYAEYLNKNKDNVDYIKLRNAITEVLEIVGNKYILKQRGSSINNNTIKRQQA